MNEATDRITIEEYLEYLYKVYKTKDAFFAERVFLGAFSSANPIGGREALVNYLQQYVETNSAKLAKAFKSQKEQELKSEKIRDISVAFDAVAGAVNDLLDDYRKGYNLDEIEKPYLTAHDLFKMDVSFVKTACSKYMDDAETSQSVISLLEKIKNTKSISKIFQQDDYYAVPFEELIYTLYDFNLVGKELFQIEPSSQIEYAKEVFNDVIPSVFRNSKNYFDKLAVLNLDRYRPSLISKKKFATEINKIIFYRNLLNFDKTGIIPTFDGFVLGHADQYQDVENLKTQLRKIYSLGFDFEKFKTMQSNIIFNPEDLNLVPQKIIAHRTCRKNNSKAMGIVLADKDENVFYLIHAYIEDELNPASTYEIQLNVLFDGNIENRVQLIRLDNWETQQSHKNIANKLQTKTHTHFYNQFDLIRGKENGGFDISHNLENGAVTFDKAFVTFVKSLGLKLALQKDILKQISKSNPSTGTGL